MQKTDWKSTRLMAIACAFALAFSMMALVACGSSGASSAASSAASDASASASEASESASAESAASESASAESAASEAASSESAEAAEPAEAKTQSGTVTTSLDMTGYEAGKVVRAWVPVPTNGDYQVISDEAIVADGATKAEMTEDELGNKMAYIEWDASVDPAARKADVSFHAVRTEALRPDLSAESGEIPAEISEKYLGSSKMVATEDPAVVALAEEITAGKTTCVDKAQAIYDWIYDNMERDNDVVGCGDGDVCRLITEDQRAGKCTDIGSVFIALCRASGVPANEMFGIRMNADDITGNQHCWVEFYAPGVGWVPVDIADVLKAVLNDKLEKDSAEALEKKEYYWGQWDEKRVEYSQGRDLTLEPAQAGEALNDFGYPYAEVDGEVIDFYKPEEFVYSIAFAADDASEAAAPAAAPAEAKTQSGTVTTSLDMTKYDQGKVVRAWVPMPTNGDYQVIADEAIVADGATKAEITEDGLGNKMAYIEWDASVDPAVRKADVSFHAVRTEALRPEIKEEGEVPADIAKTYLGSSKMVAADDPEVVALAQEITKDQTTFEGKARAVYDWIYDNMERDNDVVGCGDGDVCRLITEDQRAGKCTDIGSVFIALCRASGVPANEMFGIRMNADDITGNQHCWVEFYAPGVGWVPVDIADVLKAVLNDKLEKDSAEALEKKEYYWGQWDEKRVEYSQGRDLTLEPAQAGEALNDFGYPYAEVDGEVIDFYKPEEFVYSVSFVTDAAAEAAAYASTIEVKDTNIEKQNISADDLMKAIEGKDDSVVILDLRNADDVKASTIEGAIPASMQKAVEEGDFTNAVANLAFALKGATGSETGADKKIVLVCYTGNKYAQAATDALKAMGADMANVFTLEGGAKGWAEAGKPMA